jgi:uncharacterized membrane protein YeaQ/YmgE (transglycosylase-associated protein family)
MLQRNRVRCGAQTTVYPPLKFRNAQRLLAGGPVPDYPFVQVAPGRGFRGGTHMSLVDLIIWLIIGGVAGWLAGLIVKGFGFGLVGNIVIGIVGAVIAGFLLPRLGIIIGGGVIAAIINAVIGAVILLLIIGVIKRAT